MTKLTKMTSTIQVILNQKMASLQMVLIYSIILWSAKFVTVSTDTPCPAVAQLWGSYNISAKIVYDKFAWVRPTDSQNIVTCSPTCSGTTTYTATEKNTQNITTLTIGNVLSRDAGTWVISDTGTLNVTACHLTVAGLPNCTINSSMFPDSLEPNSELTLVAGIRGYYCSKQARFELTTGREAPDVLLKNNTVTDVTDIVLNTTFNVTLKRLGDVKLDFTCYNETYRLSCQGAVKLLKSPPECDTSSSRNGSLFPGTSLTLTVNITNYYCTEEAAFDLITGNVEQELVPGHRVVGINSTVVEKTFNVTRQQDGDIKLNFTCDGTHRELHCSGDKKITVASPTTSTSTGSHTGYTSITTSTSIITSTNTPPKPASVPVYLIIGIVVALLVLLIIIFVLVVCRNRIIRVARKYSITRKRPKVRNLRENDKPNKGKRMSQINPEKKADFVQNVLGSTADPASEEKGASATEMAI
ncbi:uncharacterized protein [Haliotis asinina]|uniref:uncharacterized protein n=1 Tax=Haliotis asinina TaxID=109174 RepID=UPI0035325D8F